MRKRPYIYYIVLCVLLAMLPAGCTREKTWRIGVSQCSSDDWRAKMNDEIHREIMFHPEAEVEIRSGNDNNEKQIADIRYFMDNKFDIILCAPNEADAITPVVEEAMGRGFPVVIFDRNINSDNYTAYMGVDNYEIGREAGQYAANMVGPDAPYIELYGLPGSTPADGRHNGFVAVAGEPVASAAGNWNYEDARPLADSMLRAHPEAKVVYAHNDRMAIAASEAARELGLSPYIIGIDAAPEIGMRAVADGVIDATFLYPTEGQRLIRTALEILEGEPFDTIQYLPLASAVDKANADILLLQNESLREETDKMRLLKTQVDDYWERHSAQTILFYSTIAIVVLLSVILFMLLRAFWQHRRHQAEIEAATASKLVFFTNVSHDLRTPLTLIAEPVHQIAGADNLTERQRTMMRLADKNVKILQRLINQILDFRKQENGKLTANLTEVPVAEMLGEWADAFTSVALKRDIDLSVNIDLPQGFTAAMDAEKMERVVFNLISNAFKHTPDNGTISLRCNIDGERLIISVADTGEGIPAGEIDRVFERFYQVDKIHPKGSGIGLTLAKAFVELHGGSVSAASEPGKGSVFTVVLPVRHVDIPGDSASAAISGTDVAAELDRVEASADADISGETPDGKPVLLVIDDNEDIRRLLSELMGDEYAVVTASDGRQGVRMAAKYVPDLIICDVMMPGMDGMECCRVLKNEESTSHIPVLMLTACTMDEQRIEGYSSGADGYLSKPFSGDVLRARAASLVANRKRIRDLWQGTAQTPIAPAPPRAGAPVPEAQPAAQLPATDIDSEFYRRFLRLVDAQIGDPELGIDSLAAQMGLGRSQFYRKIKALTNYSPVELLRRIRITRAHHLLTTTEKTVSEIAYEVGFSTPAYFTKCYREAYGQTPSERRRSLSQ